MWLYGCPSDSEAGNPVLRAGRGASRGTRTCSSGEASHPCLPLQSTTDSGLLAVEPRHPYPPVPSGRRGPMKTTGPIRPTREAAHPAGGGMDRAVVSRPIGPPRRVWTAPAPGCGFTIPRGKVPVLSQLKGKTRLLHCARCCSKSLSRAERSAGFLTTLHDTADGRSGSIRKRLQSPASAREILPNRVRCILILPDLAAWCGQRLPVTERAAR